MVFVARDQYGYKLAMIVCEVAPTATELELYGFDDLFTFREELESEWCKCGDLDCHARTYNNGSKCHIKTDLSQAGHMDTLTALKWLRDRDQSCNEWYEAGMWYATKTVLSKEGYLWNEAELQMLLDDAKAN